MHSVAVTSVRLPRAASSVANSTVYYYHYYVWGTISLYCLRVIPFISLECAARLHCLATVINLECCA